jgi:hypothetical protein
MSRDYLPVRQAELDAWMANFIATFPTIAKQLGFTDAEISFITNMLISQRNAFGTMNFKKKEASSSVAGYDTITELAQSHVRKATQRMKGHTGFTEELGKTMGVIGSSESAKTESEQTPEFKVAIDGGGIVITFKKNGHQGLKFFGRRGPETQFTFLAIDTSSPYEDNRPNLVPGQPEKREYIAYFIDNDEQTGLASAIYSIII